MHYMAQMTAWATADERVQHCLGRTARACCLNVLDDCWEQAVEAEKDRAKHLATD